MDDLHSGAAYETGRIATDCESDETPVGSIATRQDFTCDGNSSEGTVAVIVPQRYERSRREKVTYPKLTMV